MDGRLIRRLMDSISGRVIPGSPLSEHSTYRVGGPAELLVVPRDSADLERLCIFAFREEVPLLVLGAGSNVIAPDEGVMGIVAVAPGDEPDLRYGGDSDVSVESGMMLDAMIDRAAAKDLGGLASLAGIPGTVGGALVMNAGTDKGCVSDLLLSVTVLTRSGKREEIPSSELRFGYRSSDLAGMDAVILEASFRLTAGDGPAIMEEVSRIREQRESKYPYDLPSAGSVFKRPEGDYAGRLIEEAGCKGLRVGGAMVSPMHANFIVNTGNATSGDITSLIGLIREMVYSSSGVKLELEQIILPSRAAPDSSL